MNAPDFDEVFGASPIADPVQPSPNLREVAALLLGQWKLLVGAPLAAGLLALGSTYLVTPTYTAVTTFLPPQHGQSAAMGALASLGSLSGIAGSLAGVRKPADQYVSLMESVTVSDRIVDSFGLMEAYKADFKIDARRTLTRSVRITVGKKDGLITVEVDDHSPKRAADIANRYVAELRRMTETLAVTEAQQRRAFFDQQLRQSRDRLARAQNDLESSGFNSGALKAEPKAAADAYAKLRAEATAAEVRLQTMRGNLAEGAPEVLRQRTELAALRAQLSRTERASEPASGPDYIGKYREFKYQETLFDLYAREFEIARADESREGVLIQVVDPATPPEKRSSPKRTITAMVTTAVVFLALAAFVVLRGSLRGARPTAPSTPVDGRRI